MQVFRPIIFCDGEFRTYFKLAVDLVLSMAIFMLVFTVLLLLVVNSVEGGSLVRLKWRVVSAFVAVHYPLSN